MKKILLAILLIGCWTGLKAQSITLKGKTGERVISFEKKSPGYHGFFNFTDIGLMIGSPENSRPAPFSFMTTNGFHVTKQLFTGIGVGIEFPSGSYMPIVLDTRYYIRDTPFSPYLFLYGGYALALDDTGNYYGGTVWYDEWGNYQENIYEPQGGWLLNPGFGIRHMFGDNFGMTFSVGYRFQRLYYTSENKDLITDYNRLMLKVGISFR